MDSIDKKIINILQEDSKITNAQLAKEINLSPSSTLERVRRLETLGIITKYTIILNREKIGLGFSFLTYIKLNSLLKESIENFIEIINDIPEIVEAHKISGDFDFILKLYCKSIKEYDYLISEIISDIEEVKHIKTELILNSVKENLSIPLKIEKEEKLQESY